MTKKWVQKAKLKKGTLRRTVRSRFGKRGFTARGTIKTEVLHKLAKEKGPTGRRARLAITLRRIKR